MLSLLRCRVVNSANNVTEAHLAAITRLDFGQRKHNIRNLKSGDFDGLTGLAQLQLDHNQLSTLPSDIFNGLTALTYIRLDNNQLSSLPANVFEGLAALESIQLYNNQLSALPSELFDGLTSLSYITLANNQISTLPDGIFEGLTALRTVRLVGNAVDPMPLTVSLEKVANGQFKAVAPAGAPFDIVLPLIISNGNTTGGATTLTIPTGNVESETLTATRTPGTTFAVTVNIGTLPAVPRRGIGRQGYELVKPADLPLVFTEFGGSAFTPVRDRTPQVRAAIVSTVPGINSASDVTEAHLAAITSLNLLRRNITTLKASDFDGLTALTSLDLSDNQLSTLPEGIFDDLTALTTLELNDNQLSTLPADIFDALAKLRELHLYNNQFSTLPAGIFDGLSWLDQLFMQSNQLTTLPAGIFDKQTGLRTLNLEDNQLSTLPVGIFNKLTELNYLTLADNRLTTLPEGIFDGPSALYDLWLDGNQFTTLPVGIFKMKASFLTLRKLYLEDNAVDPLSLTVSLKKVADSQFKAVAPAGATFDFALQISVANGTITGGATNITISKGSVESDTLTVTRTAGTIDAVTVDISYPLPELPTNHQGYELVKSADLPLEVVAESIPYPVSNRTAAVRDAIVAAVPDVNSASDVTEAHLAEITELSLNDKNITSLKTGDFFRIK